MKIIIADDHTIVRKGLKLILEEEYSFLEFDEAANGDELIEKVTENDYDLVMLDIVMPGKDAFDTLKAIKDLKPNLPALIFSMIPEKNFAIRTIRAGASGYLNKDCSQEQLIDAINKTASGRDYISPSLFEQLPSQLRKGADKSPHEKLSDREFQVMRLLAEGHKLEEISKKLYISKNTVSNYRNSLLKKMELRNNSELTIYAIKNHLIA